MNCTEDEYVDYSAPDELSDISWIVSINTLAQNPYNLISDTSLSFFDLSQGDVSHQWIIEEGNYYLEEGFTANDSLDLFIDEDKGLTINNDKAHVLFKNSGLNTVTLLNKFNNPVNLNFSEEYLNSENIDVTQYEEGGMHVVDAKFIFDVYGELKPAFKVYQDGNEILHVTEEDMPSEDDMDSWPEVEVEAGAGLTFVDLTTEDRPNNRQWLFEDGVPSSTNQEEALIKFFSLGTFTGSMRSMRLAPLPNADATKLIPLKVKVIPSSQPFVYDGNLKEDENQKISFRVAGEVSPFSGQEGNFTVHVTNNTSGFDMNIPVQNAQVKPDNATHIELTLSQPIYNTDQITISYSGGGITSTDTRVLEDFGPVGPVQMHFGSNILPTNGWGSFEPAGGGVNNAYASNQYFIPAGNGNGQFGDLIWERVTSPAPVFDGDASMQFKLPDVSIPLVNLFGFSFAKPNGISAGTYRISYYVYKESGTTLNAFRMEFGNPITDNKVFDISNINTNEWVKVSQTITFPNDLAVNYRTTLKIIAADNPGVSGAQLLYFDDLQLIELEQRP